MTATMTYTEHRTPRCIPFAHRVAAGDQISQPTWTLELLVRPSQGASGMPGRMWGPLLVAARISSFGNPGSAGRSCLVVR
jgi:hypothetical protein